MDAFDDEGVTIGSVRRRMAGYLDVWGYVGLTMEEDVICGIEVIGPGTLVFLDDFKVCRYVEWVPADTVEDLIEEMSDIEIPDDAPPYVETVLDRAIADIESALAQFECGDEEAALRDLTRAVFRMVLVQDEVPGLDEVIVQALEVAERIADDRIMEAEEDADSPLDELRLSMARSAFDQALALVDQGSYSLAMTSFRMAFHFADMIEPL